MLLSVVVRFAITCLLLLANKESIDRNQACSRINLQAYEKIRVGMTRAQVQMIIGVPRGNYTDPRAKAYYECDIPAPPLWEWIGNDFAIIVYYGNDGKVVQKCAGRVRQP